MQKFKLNILAAIVTCCFTSASFAQDATVDEKEKLAQSYQTNDKTVTTEQLVEEVKASSEERDRLRNVAELSDFSATANKSLLSKYESQRELKIMEFIVENVPSHILAAGEKAVQAYIMETFIENKGSAPGDEVQFKKIWSSTDSALSVAPEMGQQWTPTIDNGKVNPQEPVAVITEEPEEKNGSDAGMTDEELATLRQLGLTEDELRAMLGGETPDPVVDEVKKQPPEPELTVTTVTISDIEIGRVAILGDITLADIKLSMNASRGGDSRRVTKTFKDVSPGYMFQVDDVRFEVIAINKQQVVVENVESKKTYRKLINS